MNTELSEMARLTGIVRRCNLAKETCNIKDCYHHVLHEFDLSCNMHCLEHSSAACVQMYGGVKVKGIDQGELRLLRMCCNCGEIQETQHMRYDNTFHGWLCQACRPRPPMVRS